MIDKAANWSRRRPRLAATLMTLVLTLVAGALATAFQASVENARVATGYGFIDEIEARLPEIEIEMANLRKELDRLESPAQRRIVENQLAALQAEFEMAEKDRMAISLAITGFTILSPEERARQIIRDSIWDDIEEHIVAGDYYRARESIRFALRYHEGVNMFGFSQENYEALTKELEKVESQIEVAEEHARDSAAAARIEPGD